MTTPPLHPDFFAFIASLARHRVRYVVVGAHALAVIGRARMTDDLDVLVEPSNDNAVRIAAALRDFGGFDALAEQIEAYLAEPDRLVSIGRPPVSIDILTSLSGVTCAEAWAGHVEVEIKGLSVPFLGLTEMVKTKQAGGGTYEGPARPGAARGSRAHRRGSGRGAPARGRRWMTPRAGRSRCGREKGSTPVTDDATRGRGVGPSRSRSEIPLRVGSRERVADPAPGRKLRAPVPGAG